MADYDDRIILKNSDQARDGILTLSFEGEDKFPTLETVSVVLTDYYELLVAIDKEVSAKEYRGRARSIWRITSLNLEAGPDGKGYRCTIVIKGEVEWLAIRAEQMFVDLMQLLKERKAQAAKEAGAGK